MRVGSKHRGPPSDSDDRHEIDILPGLQVTLRYLLTYNGHYSRIILFILHHHSRLHAAMQLIVEKS
jgi:hypothetical protein